MKKFLISIMFLLGFTISIFNGSNGTIIYRAYRFDHSFPQLKGPLQYAVGELKPGAKSILKDRSGTMHEFIIERKDGSKSHFAFDAIPSKIFIGITEPELKK